MLDFLLRSSPFSQFFIEKISIIHFFVYLQNNSMCVTMMNNNEFKAYTPENIKETPNNWKLRSGQGGELLHGRSVF